MGAKDTPTAACPVCRASLLPWMAHIPTLMAAGPHQGDFFVSLFWGGGLRGAARAGSPEPSSHDLAPQGWESRCDQRVVCN